MALKFLNKKGWHTGSLRNIENVWKAEQKHEAEQRKLEELRKQIHEERERADFLRLQEQAGIVPRQERLDFLYESGLAVGKGSSEGFKALQAPPSKAEASASEAGSSSKAAVPGALFEEKPQSANDAWRKLHTDPLLLIRQREQEAISRIKNNPIQMAMIKKSVEAKKQQKQKSDKKEKKKKKEHKKHHHSKSKHDKHLTEYSDSEDTDKDKEERSNRSRPKHHQLQEDREEDGRKGGDSASERRFSRLDNEEDRRQSSDCRHSGFDRKRERTERNTSERHHPGSDRGLKSSHRETKASDGRQESGYKQNNRRAPTLTDEERAARIREMQQDAELHEEQRWKRIKKASDIDAREAIKDEHSGGKNFLDAAQKSMFGTEKGGSSTIEESVRRRTYYSQGGIAAHETNAFRRR